MEERSHSSSITGWPSSHHHHHHRCRTYTFDGGGQPRQYLRISGFYERPAMTHNKTQLEGISSLSSHWNRAHLMIDAAVDVPLSPEKTPVAGDVLIIIKNIEISAPLVATEIFSLISCPANQSDRSF